METRAIPFTAASQFPDNVERPFWSLKGKSDASDDFFDCYVSFKELECQEYLWEWKSRKLDELIINKLVGSYRQYFSRCQIGDVRRITLMTGADSSLDELGRIFMSIMTSNEFAQKNGLFTPPLSEIVNPSTTNDGLLRIAKLFNESVAIATEEFQRECNPKTLSIIPVHVFDKDANWFSALNSYFKQRSNAFRERIETFRPLIDRAALADSKGFVGSVLATRRALSGYGTFSEITGIAAKPIIDAGPLMFRGGLSPGNVDRFLQTYAGIRTATVRPSLRFDFPLEDVRSVIRTLNNRERTAFHLSNEELDRARAIGDVFETHYRTALSSLPSLDVFPEELRVIDRR